MILAECRCDAEERMGNFFCSDIKMNMQNLCDIDLTKTVHEQKIKLLQEEKREREILQKQKEKELQRKRKQEELARIEQEKINRQKILEEIVVDEKIDMGLSDVDILRTRNENKKDRIEIKKIEMEEDEKEIEQ